MEAELLLTEEAFQSGDEFTAEHPAEHFYRKKEMKLRRDPARMVRGMLAII